MEDIFTSLTNAITGAKETYDVVTADKPKEKPVVKPKVEASSFMSRYGLVIVIAVVVLSLGGVLLLRRK